MSEPDPEPAWGLPSFRDMLGPRTRSGWLVWLAAVMITLVLFVAGTATGQRWLLWSGLVIIPGLGWYAQRRKWL